MGACGAILCGVSIFIGFAILSDVLESASGGDSSDAGYLSSNGALFVGRYSLEATVSNDTRIVEGACQLRGLSRGTGAMDVGITTLELRLEHDSIISEVTIRTGLLLQNGDNTLDFFGTGFTDPFMFPIIRLPRQCAIEHAGVRFTKSSPAMVASGTFQSKNCDFQLKFDVDQVNLHQLKRKIVHYSIMSNAVSLGLIKLFIDQMSLLESNSSFARIAMGMVLMQSVSDSIESMFNFFTGLSVQFLFNVFIIVSLFRFVLFSFFEMRFIILAWRSVNHQILSEMDDIDAARLERNWIQSRLYLPLAAALILIILYPKASTVPLTILAQLYWVPQIVFDVYKGHKAPLTTKYIVGVSVCRLIVPLYVWGCPHNIFNGQLIARPYGNSGLVTVSIVVLQLVQVGLMLTQQRFGPRWFVPWMCLPHVYNYYRRVELDEEFGVPECVVCMSEIDTKGDDAKKTVVTPCGHFFHSQCLQQWIDFGKMECPLCRGELPPIT